MAFIFACEIILNFASSFILFHIEPLTSTSRILTPDFHDVLQSPKRPTAPKSTRTLNSRTTTPKTTTAKLLRPRALKNNKNILGVHLPTLISSFISENDIQPNLKSQIMSAVEQSENNVIGQKEDFEEENENSQEGMEFILRICSNVIFMIKIQVHHNLYSLI